MDIRMPEIDGYQATKYIRNNNLAPQSLIIALSANVGDEESLQQNIGLFDDFISKPIDMDKLKGYLYKWLVDKKLN